MTIPVGSSQTVEVFSVQTDVRSYWRLTALDTFNGNIWASNESYKSVGAKLPGAGRAVPGPQSQQQFTIATLDSIWLPAAYEPVRIDGIKDVSYNQDSASLISSSFFCSFITKEYAVARHDDQRPCSARVAAPSAASPSAGSRPVPGGSPRSVHACGSVI